VVKAGIMDFVIFFLLIIVVLVIPGFLADRWYLKWRKKRIEEGKKVDWEINPFKFGHVLLGLLAGSLLVLIISSMIAHPEKVTWDDLWGTLGVSMFLFLIGTLSYFVYRGEDPEVEANRLKFFGIYFGGTPRRWEFTIKYLPVYMLVLAGTFLLVSLATLITLLVS
jgi:hypothetical protein